MVLNVAHLLACLAVSWGVTGTSISVDRSVVPLALSRKLNLTSVHNLVRHDQSRARALKSAGNAKHENILEAAAVISSPVDNQAVTYVASVGIGSPPTTCEYHVVYTCEVRAETRSTGRPALA